MADGPTRIGRAAEDLAAGYLAGEGWRLLARNLRLGRSELDIVALDPGPPARLVVVEVRARADREHGLAEETVDWRKRARLRAGVGRLLAAGRLPDGSALPRVPVAIDVIAVEPPLRPGGPARLRHHRDALAEG
jgi:putative endonuclease